MLFVLSAAVRFHAKPVTECVTRSTPRLASKAKALVSELRKLEPKDIKKQLHVNDALAKEYAKTLNNFEGTRPVPAVGLYDNKMFASLDATSWEYDDADWAQSNIRVLSGLYGLLKPFDEIQPLSLPVGLGTKLPTSKGKFLRDYWRESVQKELNDSLQKLPMPVIINCASEEDTMGIYDEAGLPEGTRIANIDFKTIERGAVPEAVGEFVRWAIERRCMTVEELLDFKGNIDEGEEPTYRLSPKSQGKDMLVFEEAIGEGSGGGWGKKMAEFGSSKGKFIKEFASGKDRYKRSEINKAMVKETKKNRKKTGPVC